MNNRKGQWVFTGAKSKELKPTESDKREIQKFFQPLIEDFKMKYIENNPNRESNYLIDVYIKWHGSYLYFCEKYKSESENRIADEFETKLLRLKFIEKDLFELSYFRHTGQWQAVVPFGMNRQDCKEMIISVPVFHPIG